MHAWSRSTCSCPARVVSVWLTQSTPRHVRRPWRMSLGQQLTARSGRTHSTRSWQVDFTFWRSTRHLRVDSLADVFPGRGINGLQCNLGVQGLHLRRTNRLTPLQRSNAVLCWSLRSAQLYRPLRTRGAKPLDLAEMLLCQDGARLALERMQASRRACSAGRPA